jgi:hypothetical protein
MALVCLIVVIVGSVGYGMEKNMSTGFCNWMTILLLVFHLVQSILLQTVPKFGYAGRRSGRSLEGESVQELV